MITSTITSTKTYHESPTETENEQVKTKLKFKELKLKEDKKVHWSEDTVNNEGMGKKKSKICCIYHRPRLNPDDPSSDESCSSCDEKGKNAYERPNHYEKQCKDGHNHNHKHGKNKIV